MNTTVSANNPVKLANIYSTLLAVIYLPLKRVQSENRSGVSQWQTRPEEDDLENIFEEASSIKDVCDFPELSVIKRLSCFEDICSSSQYTTVPNLVHVGG